MGARWSRGARGFRVACGGALAAALVACAADAKSGDPVAPPFTGGKADVGERVTDRGPLGFGAESAVASTFTEDLEFHGYTIAVRPGAVVTLDVTQRGSSRGIDTTLFVYGPRTGEGYGTSAIATDDDAGWGRLSRIRARELDAGGTYLVVVGTHDARGRGNYRLEMRCESGECAALPAPAGACHPAIAGAIRACVDDWMTNDPEWYLSATRRDLVEQCADAEPIAGAWGTLCASPEAPPELCAISFEEVAAAQIPVCRREVWNDVLDATCALGDRYHDLFEPGAIVVVAARELSPASSLTATQRAQVIAAVRAAYDEVTTVGAAFAAVDESAINHVELWDASNRRAFTAYEYGAGDNSYGSIFDHGTTNVAARINDGDLLDCAVTWGPEMRDCATDADCSGALRCAGVAEAIQRGRCVDLARDEHAAEGGACVLESGCPPASGLVCAGAATSGAGFCRPAWMRGRFTTEPGVAIPDASAAGAEAQLVAYGLATVDTDVVLDLVISHPRIRDLRVSLVSPAGAEVIVFDRERDGGELYLASHAVRGFSGDEEVNGVWRLRAVDTVSGRVGTISRFALTLTSRWD